MRAIVARALAEDIGSGDRTTLWTVPMDRRATGRIIVKEAGILAGSEALLETFRQIDRNLVIDQEADDGNRVRAGQQLFRLEGSARSILTGERVALNFLQRLSGVATLTRAFVDAVEGTDARILDTRKTTPGLRMLEKAAVRHGGGDAHRLGLFDMVLIKENHIRAAGGITAAVEAVVRANDEGLLVEVETTNAVEVREAITAGVDRILFDNMATGDLADAVELVRASGAGIETEASGGVTLATVAAIARTGVDFISVGALTHSAPALDVSLLVDVG